MKQSILIHYIIGISAFLLCATACYFIQINPKNLISAGIIALASSFVAFSQYVIIRAKKKNKN